MSVIASFEQVSYDYGAGQRHTDHSILKDLSLEVQDGEMFVLLGPSGCGKTTALNLLAGFLHPTRGQVLWRDTPVTAPGPERVVIFQGDDSLFYWQSASENVAFPLRMRRAAKGDIKERVAWALEAVNLLGHEQKLPRELSGGMKQRIQIARAFVTDAPLLLMDEPFGALDAMTRSELQELLVEIWQQTSKTGFFITHDTYEAVLLASRVGIMTRGPNAQLAAIIDVALPRPRSRTDPALLRVVSAVDQALSATVRSA